ncbi:MAG: hypothetical protein GWN58_33685 [Anaerolineae bacterium]|nr:hypothetical protein [Thermoplasmata archaeon]NIV34230.1 hypothetical protein [Anaerolineae bacterium]NIY06078.1 hypothetical protein [Thermoplasmata archaeon]
MSQVIGLAYVKPAALHLVVRNKGFDARIFPGDIDWKKHMASKGRAKKIAIVEDKRQLKKALDAGLPLIVVCVDDIDWLERRGIRCLDGYREDGLDKQVAVTPTQIYTELGKSEVFTTSKTDMWLTKSNPDGRCAGCKHMYTKCGYEPTPTAKRPCGDEYEANKTSNGYLAYNLSQLIHLALNNADEDKLMDHPQDFWRATYAFATGQMPRNEWITEHARLLKSAGTSKGRLQSIVMWAKKYGSTLKAGKIENPPSKLDVRLADKLLKQS